MAVCTRYIRYCLVMESADNLPGGTLGGGEHPLKISSLTNNLNLGGNPFPRRRSTRKNRLFSNLEKVPTYGRRGKTQCQVGFSLNYSKA